MPVASDPFWSNTTAESSSCFAATSTSATLTPKAFIRSSGVAKSGTPKSILASSSSSSSSSLASTSASSFAHNSSNSLAPDVGVCPNALPEAQRSCRFIVVSHRSWSAPNSLSASFRAFGAKCRAALSSSLTFALAASRQSRALAAASDVVAASVAFSACVVSSMASGSSTSTVWPSRSSATKRSTTASLSSACSNSFKMLPLITCKRSSKMLISASVSVEAFWRLAARAWRTSDLFTLSASATFNSSIEWAARMPSSKTSSLLKISPAVFTAFSEDDSRACTRSLAF
mmetsp:Transcript_73374/g.203701  ORF Transcript_73374/g.203701 Transcript_73374/m.203701 type:complete len:288 (-) Transcript_73374:914-1777(-)